MNQATTLMRDGGLGAVAGFLTRPCCVLPSLLSVAGVGSIGAVHAFTQYRGLWLAASAGTLLASTIIAFRREGGTAAKIASVAGSVIAFLWAAGSPRLF